MTKILTKEEKGAVKALITLNIARGNISDEQDINEVEHQISRFLNVTRCEQRDLIEEMIREAIK